MLPVVVGALGITDPPICRRLVGISRAVFGDVQRPGRIVTRHSQQLIIKRFGIHQPVHGRVFTLAPGAADAEHAAVLIVVNKGRSIVVETQKIGGRGDGIKVGGFKRRHAVAVKLEHILGIAPAVERIQKPAIEVAVVAHCSRLVCRAVAGRIHLRQVKCDANLCARAIAPNDWYGLTVCQQQRMYGG